MADPIKRRDFIKAASLFGTSIAIVNPVSAGSFLPGNDNEIKNDYFAVSFDRGKGVFNIFRSNGIPLLTGGAAWGSGDVLFRDYDSYNLKLVDNNIIRVHVRFEKAERLQWEIKTDEFFK
jgi:hypothetical protein